MSGDLPRAPGAGRLRDDAVYRAEARAGGRPVGWRTFARWSDVVAWVRDVVAHPDWADAFPDAPLDVEVHRRSRSSRYSAAHVDSATVWIRDGSWESLTVLHELAHLAVGPTAEPHGPPFVAALLTLVRRFVGVEAWAALRSDLTGEGIGDATLSQ